MCVMIKLNAIITLPGELGKDIFLERETGDFIEMIWKDRGMQNLHIMTIYPIFFKSERFKKRLKHP